MIQKTEQPITFRKRIISHLDTMFSYALCLSALGNFLYLEDMVVEFLTEATFTSVI